MDLQIEGMQPSLEDFYEDILGKAKKGLEKQDEEVIREAGISSEQWQSALAGEFDEDVAARVAPVLGLSPSALIQTGQRVWKPDPVEIQGVKQIHTQWEDMYVNAYLVWDQDSRQAVLFDSGAGLEALLDCIQREQLKLELILLTHAHPDHVAVLPKLQEAYPEVPVFLHANESYPGKQEVPTEGDVFQVGSLTIEARYTPGHSPGGTTYVITGLEKPVAIVGDALFSGSMGGSPQAWKPALQVNRDKILSLPGETVLCPGHGPMTTVAEELEHNPFYGPGSKV